MKFYRKLPQHLTAFIIAAWLIGTADASGVSLGPVIGPVVSWLSH